MCESLCVFIYSFFLLLLFLKIKLSPSKDSELFIFLFESRVYAGDARCYLPPVSSRIALSSTGKRAQVPLKLPSSISTKA